jgi:hypothetical protein
MNFVKRAIYFVIVKIAVNGEREGRKMKYKQFVLIIG